MVETLQLSRLNFSGAINASIDALKKPGSFIAIPTETVYGLACLWSDAKAKENIYKAKDRDGGKPFQMLASDIAMARRFGCVITGGAEKAAKAFCPGPLTLVVPSFLSTGEKIGFRIPADEFILELIKRLGEPLAATSANISGEPPALRVAEVARKLKVLPELVIDGGELPENSRPSTVVEFYGGGAIIIREGPISISDIERIALV